MLAWSMAGRSAAADGSGASAKRGWRSNDRPHRWYLAAHSKPKCATVQMGLGLPELAVDRQGIVKGPIRQTMGAVTDHRLTDTAVGSELPRGHREAAPHRDSVALASRWTLVSSRSARQNQLLRYFCFHFVEDG